MGGSASKDIVTIDFSHHVFHYHSYIREKISGLEFAICLSVRGLCIYCQIGLHFIVTKTSGFPIFVEMCIMF